MNKIDVSIVVPLYNKENEIRRCLNSLIEQFVSNIEIIVVDDGSKDGSADVVREYTDNDPRVHLIVQKNQGPGAARNTGVKASRGKYIGFVDCDDFVDKNMYKHMMNALEETGAEIAVCQEKNLYNQNGTYQMINETKFPFDRIKKVESSEVLNWLLNYRFLSLNSACFKLIRRELFFENDIWFPEERFVEDIVLSAAVLSVANNVAVVPESLYMYVHEMGTRSTSFSIKKAYDILQNMKDISSYVKKYKPLLQLDNFVLGMCFSSMRQFYGAIWENKIDDCQNDKKQLISEWKKMKKGISPSLKNVDMPAFHKIKIIMSWLNMEKIACRALGLMTHIPFFKYMS